MADEDVKKQSTFGINFLDSANRLPALDLDPAKVKQFWDAVNEEADKYFASLEDNASVLDSILEDEKAKRKAIHDKEVENQKTILKLEMAIAKAKADNQKKEEKHLEKRLKIVKQAQDVEKKTQEIVSKYQDDMDARENLRRARKEASDTGKKLISDGWNTLNFKEIKEGIGLALTGGLSGGSGVIKALDTMTKTLSNLIQKLDTSIEEISKYKSDWDTRLFGSESSHSSLVKEIASSVGISPFVKQADIMKNIDKAIESGISYNVSQRAFLESVKDDIARTFDSFDSTLLQIVRVQQSDSTAARLGMEATLNQFLNSMYSNTEYLNSLSDSVTGALYEATSLLSSSQSIGFEYQVQKWLGSLYSVGMSQQSINSIAQALGELASGNISNIDSGAGRLLVMAASRSGNLNYSDLLTKGINDSQINELLYSMVTYLAQIANSNKVVQTQYADIFGLNTSDIIAAKNLQSSVGDIASSGLNYGGSIAALNKMAASIGSRQNMGEWLDNAMSNFQYTMASGIAENPVLYSIWKMSNLLDELVGGIALPFINVWGFGVDLETTVADLMKVGSLSAGLLSGIGSLISAASNLGSGLEGVLGALGVGNSPSKVSRGSGLSGSLGQTVSTASYIGNSSGSDVENAILSEADDQKQDLSVKATEENDNVQLEDVDDNISRIYDLLESVIKAGKINISMGNDMPFSAGNYELVFGGS